MILVTCRFFELSLPRSTEGGESSTPPIPHRTHALLDKSVPARATEIASAGTAHNWSRETVSRNRLAKPNQKLFSQAVQAIASITQTGNNVSLLVQALIAGSQEQVHVLHALNALLQGGNTLWGGNQAHAGH